VAGQRVLLIGGGDVGAAILRRLQALDASVTVVARTARPGVHAVTELGELLPYHPVVILAMALTEDTRGMVDESFLAAMPNGGLVVNVARGGVVVTEALLPELESGRLRAALDVVDPEPLPPGHPLWAAPNLLLTPHVGGGTRGWETRAYELVRDQVDRLAAGQPPLHVVA
jgi:phosphoglycerate dehydrogenase-like enzyme